MFKEKKCTGINKAFGFNGCGKLTSYRKNGLCTNCYQSFILNNDHNKVIKKKAPIKKVSDKRKEDNAVYKKLRDEFMSQKENQICPITGKPTTDLHHKKGRVGKLFLDTRYWVALSREGHKFVEENPIWAKENGYSLSRLSND